MMHFPKPRKKIKGKKIDLSRLNTAQASSVSQRGLPPSPVHHAENHLRGEVSIGSFHYSRLSFLLFLCCFCIRLFLHFNYNIFNFTSVLVFNLNDCCSWKGKNKGGGGEKQIILLFPEPACMPQAALG